MLDVPHWSADFAVGRMTANFDGRMSDRAGTSAGAAVLSRGSSHYEEARGTDDMRGKWPRNPATATRCGQALESRVMPLRSSAEARLSTQPCNESVASVSRL